MKISLEDKFNIFHLMTLYFQDLCLSAGWSHDTLLLQYTWTCWWRAADHLDELLIA